MHAIVAAIVVTVVMVAGLDWLAHERSARHSAVVPEYARTAQSSQAGSR
jgi:hypothetical protein